MKLDFNRIKAAIFDIDGTLIDSMPIWDDISGEYLRGLGITPDPNHADVIYSMTLSEGCEYTRKHYGLDKSAEEIEEDIVGMIRQFYYQEVKPKPGVEKMLRTMKESGIAMILATSGDEDLASHALERLGFMPYFEELITCDSLATKKSETKIFEVAKTKLENALGHELLTEEICVFEDSPVAVNTTKNAGYTVDGVADEANVLSRKQIKEQSDYFYYSLEEAFGACICPVCKETAFEKDNSYEICPVCGWENDKQQKNDPEYAGGANNLSLIQYIKER